jgi:hypothetical protein
MLRAIAFTVLLILAGCKEISFPEPQPRGKKLLKTIPKNLQGSYLPLKEDGSLSEDTIVIHEKGYRFGYLNPEDRIKRSKDEYETGTLSDTLILKSFKGYYFLNFRQNPQWMLRVLKIEKNGDLTFMAPEQEDVDFKDYVKKLAMEIKIDSFQSEKKMVYQIDPTPAELVKLIEKGYFSKALLRRVK